MNKIALLIFMLMLGLMVRSAHSAPNNPNKAENNPNVVAYYPEGLHAIPTDPVTYLEGTNLVTKRGGSGGIQAWYTGDDGTGFHSVWNETKKTDCPGEWVFFADPHPEWGDYLTPGANYCVKVNAN